MNISIITNFGCKFNCWYCIWKHHRLKDTNVKTDWVKLEAFLLKHIEKGKVSVSGGGDPLYNYAENKDWWKKLFDICSKLGIKVDLHTREKYFDKSFLSNINRYAFSSDKLEDDLEHLETLTKYTNVRIIHVVTKNTTDKVIEDYLKFQEASGCQFTIKQLAKYDDNGRYKEICEKYPNIYKLDTKDYNIYYMPDNTITDKFLLEST